MEILTALLTAGVGAFILKVLESIISGVRQRARAKGQRDSKEDAIVRSRFMWREHAYLVRGILTSKCPDSVPEEPKDPYVTFLEEHDGYE